LFKQFLNIQFQMSNTQNRKELFDYTSKLYNFVLSALNFVAKYLMLDA
jgi:hypothetical protein